VGEDKTGYVALIGTVCAVRGKDGTAEIVTDTGKTEKLHDCDLEALRVLSSRFASRVLVTCKATRSGAGRLGNLVPITVQAWDPPAETRDEA
jgi:hypothetical protein